MIVNYHRDHALVAALSDSHHPAHHAVWESWTAQALRIVRHRQRSMADDHVADPADLTQLALECMVRSLPTYHYASRFSTWAYAVIAHTLQHEHRERHAAKRAVQPRSLEREHMRGGDVPYQHDLDSEIVLRALVRQVAEILRTARDDRLLRIFQLWAFEVQRLADVGRQVGLSIGRVSVLIEQARRMLQTHPALIAWRDDDHQPAASDLINR